MSALFQRSHVAVLLCSLALLAPTVSFREGSGGSPSVVALPAMAAAHVSNSSISPELDPESHKKFFGKDYPDDTRPKASSEYHKFKFKHPYPIVQDTDEFDKDYVKDENSDGGEWKAQMEYDTLRNKIRDQGKKVEEAKKKMIEEKKEWEDAKNNEDHAENKSEHAEGAAEKAKNDLDHAQDELEGADGAIGDAVSEVEKEMKDLEDCKKELAAARARLKKLLEEKVVRDKVQKIEVDEEDKAAQEAAKASKDSKSGGKFDSTVEKERAEHLAARKAYEKELQDVRETEKALDQAAQKLRDFRRSGVDKDGGVYYEKSGAARSVLPASLFAVLACFATVVA